MAISGRTRKVLWGKSGNRCAICDCALTEGGDARRSEIPIGEEAHIISRRADGPRHEPLPPNQEDAYPNLILLCPTDHRVVDDRDRLDKWTVDRLRSTKASHEARIAKQTGRKPQLASLSSALAHAEAADFVQRRNRHQDELREFLGRVPYGKPVGSLMWDDLVEHLGPGHAVWALERRLRSLVEASSRRGVVETRLFDEQKSRGLVLTGSHAVLSGRLHNAIEGTEQGYPDLAWFTEDSFGARLLKFGGGYGVAHVNSFEEAMQMINAQRELWDAIPDWAEVLALRDAGQELVDVRTELGHLLAELHHSPDFPPGHCAHCPKLPQLH